MSRIRPFLLAIVCLLALTGAGAAQIPPAPAQPSAAAAPSQADRQELLRLLGDPGMVDWLRRSAEAGMPDSAGPASHSLRAEITARIAAARARIAELMSAWSNFPLIPDVIANAWQAELSAGEALRSLTYVIVFLFVGGGLEWLFWQYFHPLMMRIVYSNPTSLGRRLAAAGGRLLLQTMGLAIFAIGSVGTFVAFVWPPFLERIVVDLLLGVIAVRALALVSRFVLAPRHPDLRLVPLQDSLALSVHRWHIVVGSVIVGALVVSDALSALARSDSGSLDAANAALAVSVTLGAVAVATIIAMIWSHWRAFARLRPGSNGARGRFDPVVFKVLPISQTVVLVTAYLLWVFDAVELMWTVLVVGTFLPASRLVRIIVDHAFDQVPLTVPGPSETATDEISSPSDEARTAAEQAERLAIYRPVARRLARFALAAIALVILATTWGTSIAAMSTSSSLAGRAVKVAIDIVAVLLIADLVWTWAKTAIDLRLARYVAPPPGEPPGPEARIATLLPLLRNMLLVAVLMLVALTVLSSLGVNIAPLIAGAGVVGVAIGFGAQSLVRDIVSGIFYLIDDAFRVGEYIEIGDLRGTVESMSLRSMRVRHHRGAVHTIPFGELKSLTNYSRDWAILKLEFRVPFDTDLKLVKKIVKQIGAELQADPNYGSQILEPLKSQGVRRMEEFNMVIGMKFMARPGAQWVIRRDAYQKLRDAFERHGISLAQRSVKVEVLSDKPLPEDVMRAVTGAAQEAVEEQRRAPQPATGNP
ncbi:membrane protein [Mesorhizobium sp. L-8-10]|uniref:mechanosensitive ion channel family protein n=1 Tax=Mesorhizobium sp. L-8-10 TaxID=2744523 RepID=UPI00192607AD|nr:mechanosensitive ion channel family protein [Mesorhizobium sp. L-8-10]BCH30203.1 membrane protein [Mesorhizobium sp. L-8-10]